MPQGREIVTRNRNPVWSAAVLCSAALVSLLGLFLYLYPSHGVAQKAKRNNQTKAAEQSTAALQIRTKNS
jgi:hypothetical protein